MQEVIRGFLPAVYRFRMHTLKLTHNSKHRQALSWNMLIYHDIYCGMFSGVRGRPLVHICRGLFKKYLSLNNFLNTSSGLSTIRARCRLCHIQFIASKPVGHYICLCWGNVSDMPTPCCFKLITCPCIPQILWKLPLAYKAFLQKEQKGWK